MQPGKLLFILSLFSVLTLSCSKSANDKTPDSRDSLVLFIMAGQSNMAGRAAIESGDTIPDPRILVLDSNNHFVVGKEPFHFEWPGVDGLDCGESFAKAMLPYIPRGVKIGLIPCAIGNTSIEQWLGDSTHGIPIYSNLLNRARIGAQHGIIRGVLWHQGESNADDTTYRSYNRNLAALVGKIRHDLGQDDLPFFAGELGPFLARKYPKQVDSEIELTARQVYRVYAIQTKGLTGKPDSVHFNSAGERGLGVRFAAMARFFVN